MATFTAKAVITIDTEERSMIIRPCVMGRWICSIFWATVACVAGAQEPAHVEISAYAEGYYTYDLSRPAGDVRPYFLYNHKQHNTASINLALIQASVKRERVRGSLGLMAGSYAQYNMAHEPAMFRALFETYVGFRLSEKRDLWLDAGVLPSHIGAEGAIGLDQITLTRSIVAENSPYYEAGARLQYKPNERLLLAALLLNGWQRIQRTPGNSRPGFGTQVQYKNKSGTTLNWSSYVGGIGPDSLGIVRVYNDFYAKVETDRIVTAIAVDFGLQESVRPNGPWDGWLAMVAMAKGRFSERWWAVGRMEYFMDDQAVMTNGLQTLAASVGLDLRIDADAMWRIEGRLFGGVNDPFLDAEGRPTSTNMAITTAFCARF